MEQNNLSPQKLNKPRKNFLPLLLTIVIALISGAVIYKITPFNFVQGSSDSTLINSGKGLKVGDVIGNKDIKQADEAIGIVDKGGFEGEGTHKLIRPGGTAQTVYLTSSVVDLDQFVGHKVTVWGETFAAQKAGWLMDVVRVRVEQLDAAQES